jgi:hypothetical protein
MKANPISPPRLQALIAALSLNRGEIESEKLAELLRLLESGPKPAS